MIDSKNDNSNQQLINDVKSTQSTLNYTSSFLASMLVVNVIILIITGYPRSDEAKCNESGEQANRNSLLGVYASYIATTVFIGVLVPILYRAHNKLKNNVSPVITAASGVESADENSKFNAVETPSYGATNFDAV